MSQRPRASLRRVLDDLGDSLLELVAGDPERHRAIDGVVIHDPDDQPVYPQAAVVLAVGVPTAEVAGLLRSIGAHGAVALVVRSPVRMDEAIRAAVTDSGVALIGLRRGATWAQLTALLRSILAEDDIGPAEPESLGGLPSGDLFAVANAIAALLDAPVTIEDRSSRVLAFSGRQDEADASRVETIIGRQVPETYTRILTEAGVFRELYRSTGPVVVPPAQLGADAVSVQRVAIAVRAGDEVLGSIWAAMNGPVTAERVSAMQDAAKLVALHLLRVRAGADVQRRLRADLVATVLEGGGGAQEALGRLGLAGRRVQVLALALRGERTETEAAQAGELERVADALAVHLSASGPSSAVAVVGGIVYALFPAHGTGPGGAVEAEERVAKLADDFCERLGSRMSVVIGIGGEGSGISGLLAARTTASRVLRVLREGMGTRRVARLADVYTQSLLLELRDLAAARQERPVGAIARLIEYDERNDSGLVGTLETWLDALGDVRAAADALFIHPNTLRYRLRRLEEVSGLDLSDPDQRFDAMLQLRILAPR